MRYFPSCAAAAAVILFVGIGAATEKTYPRSNPITEAVKKTQNSVVSVKVARPNASKDTVGTGVIIDERGYIVTNRHVVGTSRDVRVRLNSGTELPAEVVWGEASYDLAVLRVKSDKKLQALELAPVDDLMVGETVIAVGHPFGYTNTVSTGIISALGREITMPSGDTLTGLIQTNASINPGNSGGPLLNVNGELIGINVALRDGAQGISFAINAGTVKEALKKHLAAAKISGVNHGLLCQEKILGETGDRQRVVVTAVSVEADLLKGDEILAVGDRQVANAFDIERAMWDKQVGEKVSLKVVRQGKELNVTLVLSGNDGAGSVASANPTSDRRLPPAISNNVPLANPQR
jgi:serine protease Do